MKKNFIAPCKDLCFILGSSDSIGSELFKVIADGVKETIKQSIGDEQRRNYAVVNFSDRTMFSRWIPKTKSHELKSYIEWYQGGMNFLDVQVLEMLKESNDNFAALMITDKKFYPGDTLSALYELANHGNKLVILGIGGQITGQQLYENHEKLKFPHTILLNSQSAEDIKNGINIYAKRILEWNI